MNFFPSRACCWLPLQLMRLLSAFGWVYDDPPQIPQNQNLAWGRIGFLFTHQLWASKGGMEARFYRPFLTLWFLLNKTAFGLNPHWFHVTSVLAHLAASALAFFVARELLKDASAALFACAIFALHPLQAESVSWISSVNDPLAAALCFASFLVYRKARVKQECWRLVGSGWNSISSGIVHERSERSTAGNYPDRFMVGSHKRRAASIFRALSARGNFTLRDNCCTLAGAPILGSGRRGGCIFAGRAEHHSSNRAQDFPFQSLSRARASRP